MTTLPTALVPIGLMTVPAAIRRVVPLIVQDSLAACGFETRSQIIWAKNNFAIGRGHYHCKADLFFAPAIARISDARAMPCSIMRRVFSLIV